MAKSYKQKRKERDQAYWKDYWKRQWLHKLGKKKFWYVKYRTADTSFEWRTKNFDDKDSASKFYDSIKNSEEYTECFIHEDYKVMSKEDIQELEARRDRRIQKILSKKRSPRTFAIDICKMLGCGMFCLVSGASAVLIAWYSINGENFAFLLSILALFSVLIFIAGLIMVIYGLFICTAGIAYVVFAYKKNYSIQFPY